MYKSKIIRQDIKEIVEQNIKLNKLFHKSILITGANGMLASYYMYTLMYINDNFGADIKIYALVRNIEKLEELTQFSNRTDIIPVVQDVCDEIVLQGKVDYIIHMASSANPKTIITNPVGIINANVLGTEKVLNLARKDGAEIIFTSTREVYGKIDEKAKITELDMGVLDCLELRSCYPESKRLAENLIVSYEYQYGVPYKIVRIAHAYGPGMNIENDGRIMSDLISNVVNKENIILKSKGEAKRAFCYISDAISALLLITVDDVNNQVYNVANETEEISIKDLAILLKEMYSNEIIFDIKENKNQYVKFARTALDTTKLEKLGWKPRVMLKEGIKKTVCFFEEYGRK